MKRIMHYAVAAVAALGASVSLAGPISLENGPNLVTNSSFENTTTIAGSGWTVSGAVIVEGYDYFIDTNQADAHTGTKSFAGGAIGGLGLLSQTITTKPGASYNIHFWSANFGGFADGTELDVIWNGVTVLSLTDILLSGYHELVVDPMATGTTSTLTFAFRNDDGFLNIDDVSVRAVPEPALGGLLAAGAAAAIIRRRRARGPRTAQH